MINNEKINTFAESMSLINRGNFFGKVIALRGLLIDAIGICDRASIGSICEIQGRDGSRAVAEIIGFNGDKAQLMLYRSLDSLGPGCNVILHDNSNAVFPTVSWLGRVVNGLAEPIDGKGVIVHGSTPYGIRRDCLVSHERRMVGDRIDLGVRAINTFVTMCRGQRMGIFAGSGVGKSVLLSQLAKFAAAPVIVIGLIGERGREVREFIEKHLGEDGLARSVIVVATSDENALMRRRAAYLTMSIAEYFRDQGQQVLCMMDSVTRFAMASREIGLTLGEIPASRGYTPSVFSELPKLLERSGPGLAGDDNCGDITGIFTVLVDGDDHNEPIADCVRGILDGHIVLEREIAERGRFPAINVLKSVSRTLPDCQSECERNLVRNARKIMSVYENMIDMIRLGAYRKGSSNEVDEAIEVYKYLDGFLQQDINEKEDIDSGFVSLQKALACTN
jgi:flagellum-specific ATP synthase